MKKLKHTLLTLVIIMMLVLSISVTALASSISEMIVDSSTFETTMDSSTSETTVDSSTSETVGKDLFQMADTIIRDVYNNIAGISTILAGLMSTIAVVGAKLSNNQQKSDQAWDWLKRIWVAWAVINGIGAFIAYIAPLFDGYAVLP